MENSSRSARSKPRPAFLFVVLFFPMLMLACNVMNNDAENQMQTPKPDISHGVVMTGTATITHYWGTTCVNSGTAVLTINPDATISLVTDQPDIKPLDCSTTSDRLSDRATGTYYYENGYLYFHLCDGDLSTESTGWVTDVAGEGDIICYYKGPDGKSAKELMITFDVHK